MAIPREVIPAGFDSEAAGYLNRLLISIDNELDRVSILRPTKRVPDKPIHRKLYYFDRATGTEITEEGIWIYKNQEWVMLG